MRVRHCLKHRDDRGCNTGYGNVDTGLHVRNAGWRCFACIPLVAVAMGAAPARTGDGRSQAWWEGSDVKRIVYPLTADNSEGFALFRKADGREPAPLLVSLHAWSDDYSSHYVGRFRFAAEHGWHLIQPDFRGPNRRPEAMGSDWVVQDILDAVAYAKREAPVDLRRVYLVGFSGGGMAALLMAGRAPGLWAGVVAICPLVDLGDWYRHRREVGGEDDRYANEIVIAAQGNPDTDASARAECIRRSPITHLPGARGARVEIFVGLHDRVIPAEHSFQAFNALVGEGMSFSPEQIAVLVRDGRVSPDVPGVRDLPPIGDSPALLRRTSGSVGLTVFEGAHIEPDHALDWLLERSDILKVTSDQRRRINKKGTKQ